MVRSVSRFCVCVSYVCCVDSFRLVAILISFIVATFYLYISIYLFLSFSLSDASHYLYHTIRCISFNCKTSKIHTDIFAQTEWKI